MQDKVIRLHSEGKSVGEIVKSTKLNLTEVVEIVDIIKSKESEVANLELVATSEELKEHLRRLTTKSATKLVNKLDEVIESMNQPDIDSIESLSRILLNLSKLHNTKPSGGKAQINVQNMQNKFGEFLND